MDHLNKNMEEFFRKSLDRLDKEPSDQLWEALEDRLDEDKRGFGFLSNWLKALLPLLFLLLAFGSSVLYKNNTIKSLNEKLSILEKENEKLSSEVKFVDKSSLASNTFAKKNNSFLSKQSTQTEYVYLYDTIVKTKYITKYVSQQSLRPMNFSGFNLEVPNFKASLSSLISTNYHNNYAPIIFANDRVSEQGSNSVTELPNSITNLKSNKAGESRALALNFPRLISDKKGRKKAKLPEAPVIVAPLDPWGKPQFYYRGGVTARLMYSLSGERFSNSSLGGGWGFLQEIGLTTRFAITSGITFNNQEYALNGGGNVIPASQIQNFPDFETLGDQIVRVEVENEFLEFPLGFKYDFYLDNRKSFFVNPAINWSIHKPQEFNYFLADSRIRQVFSNKRLGYLSSINLLLGIERPINRYLAYQAGIAYEHNLIPIGIEKRNLRNVHLKFNLLFGKK